MADIAANPPVSSGVADYPVTLDLEGPYEIARWRPLVQWILAIPHLLIGNVLRVLTNVLTFIAFFAILFTKKYPEGLFNLTVMALRYQWRVQTYAVFMRESYPPFEFDTVAIDPRTDPATLSVSYPGEVNRWLPLVKFILAIPHLFVMVFRAIAGFFVGFAAFFAVLFTGKFPEQMRNYLVLVSRYITRVQCYIMLLRDEYPPFAIK
jgi:hypothetical protein